MVAKVEFYDGTGNEDEARDGAEPIACVLLDHIPRVGDQVWLKPFGHYIVSSVEYHVDSRKVNVGGRDVSIWLRPEDGEVPDYSSLKR
jgi:hypothetical protein